MRRNREGKTIIPIVEAIIEERRPKTQEKGKEIARARAPKSVTCHDTKKENDKHNILTSDRNVNAIWNMIKEMVVPLIGFLNIFLDSSKYQYKVNTERDSLSNSF